MQLVERLRRFGFSDPITVIGKERHLPYSRPPLSKQLLLGTLGVEDIRLQDDRRLEELDISLRLGQAAVGTDGTAVVLADGSRVEGDVLVAATGVTPRGLPEQPASDRILALRTLDDALNLRSRLHAADSLAIVGGGLIGAEVASAARSLGKRALMVEALDQPMQRILGPVAAGRLARLYAEHGVEVRVSTTVDRLEDLGDSVRLHFGDGTVAEADIALVAIGSVPNTGWLTEVEQPLECDSVGRVIGLDDTYAIGDVAAWPDAAGRSRRREHWTNAHEQAVTVAAQIAAVNGSETVKVPYVWTDQFGLKIQILGDLDAADECSELERVGEDGFKGGVLGYTRDDRLVGAVLFGAPRRLAHYHQQILEGNL
jgi:NADPH-dependent 2,4-dienoyl-CoA reductase/sulfur reductase-like enzyme